MKKNIISICLSAVLLLSFAGCNSGSSNSDTSSKNSDSKVSRSSDSKSDEKASKKSKKKSSEKKSFSPKDAIKVEEIDWSVNTAVIDGERVLSFDYTNNSNYTILDVEMKFTQKKDVTDKQRAVFNKIKKEYGYTAAEVKNFYAVGENKKCAEPGETVTGSPCCVDDFAKMSDIKQYELMEPDMITVSFIGDDGKGYDFTYDYKNDIYGESSEEGKNLQKWPDTKISKLMPKPECPAIEISSNDKNYFFFYAYGMSRDDYDEYIEELEDKGFTEVEYENDTSYTAKNEDGVEVSAYYDLSEEQMTARISKEDKDKDKDKDEEDDDDYEEDDNDDED